MVFKKFADRLVSAGTNAVSAALRVGVGEQQQQEQEYANEMRQLESMGFIPERARHAIVATDGDVDRAAEILLLGGGGGGEDIRGVGGGGGTTTTTATHVTAHNDEQMRRAMEESLHTEDTRRVREAEAASLATATAGTTVVNNARKAAAARRDDAPVRFAPPAAPTPKTKNLERTHPAVRLPDALSNKSKEEQILRCADRLKSHAMAVDTLHRALSSVRNMPGGARYRIIDRTNANYVRYVRDKPGAEDMLLAMNYRRDHRGGSGAAAAAAKDELRLERHLVDDALLYLGISALENARTSDEYVESKKSIAFHAEMRRVAGGATGRDDAGGGMTEDETSTRLAFVSRCPREPPEGRGALIQVCLGDESERIGGGRVSRRFDGDDTLEDVLHWLGGCYGGEILEKMRGASRDWCLCDLNNYPALPFDVERHSGKTLQYLGLFPSGKLGVRLSDDAWRDREERGGGGGVFDVISGSVRGLGAVSRSMLH